MFSYECKETRLACAVALAAVLTASSFAATCPIVPLPQQFQSRPGNFTLCPAQPLAAAPGHPLVKIFVDPVSLPGGQYLALQLFKSAGWQFIVATTTNGL